MADISVALIIGVDDDHIRKRTSFAGEKLERSNEEENTDEEQVLLLSPRKGGLHHRIVVTWES